jgi:GT2 family glycosyltransferase
MPTDVPAATAGRNPAARRRHGTAMGAGESARSTAPMAPAGTLAPVDVAEPDLLDLLEDRTVAAKAPSPAERAGQDDSAEAEPSHDPEPGTGADADEATAAHEPADESAAVGFLDELEADDDLLPPREHQVTAVLVCHDGMRWLPATLTALARSTRRPDRVVAVDTSSTDATPGLLARAERVGLVDRIVSLPRDTGFGAAVAAALATGSGAVPEAGPGTLTWAWLLHDDSAPAANALVELLAAADQMPSADVLGPKVRGWNNPDVLVECGLTVARSGNRVTGLERRELDQGQHDATTDVLAVGSAGMLVRREVWTELGGFDPALPMFRDDIDFCWRAQRAGHRVVVATSAVVHHREAATHGRRPVDAGTPKHPDRPHRRDRAAAIHLMRVHASGPARLFVTLRLLVGSLGRALALLLGKAPEAAADEWGAFRDSVRDRRRLAVSRGRAQAAAAAPTAVPESDVRRLLAPRGTQARHAFETVADLVAGRDAADAGRSVLDSTPDDPDGWYAEDRRPSRVRRLAARPGFLLLLSLTLLTLIGVRGLLGSGVLLGGALQPAPEGAGDLWAAYLTAWHEVGPGSAADAPTWLVPLSLLALVLRGSASYANDLLILGLIPLSGLTSYLALRGVVSHAWVRVWAAAAYATLPAVTGALSGGRLGTAASIVVLPWLARSAARLVGVGRPPTWRRAFGTALLLAVVTAFTPVAWLVAAVLAVLAGVVLVRDLAGRLRLLVTVALPFALLVPWSFRVVREPALLWLEPGLVGPSDLHLSALDVALLRPGGAGSTPLWLGIGLVLAGFAALALPGRQRRAAVAAWAVGAAALVLGVVETLLRVTPSALSEPVTPWPGVPTAIWGGALIVCGALVVDGLPSRLAGASFGWRQPAAAGLLALLVLAPLGSLALVVMGVDGPIHRGSREAVPAFVAAEMNTPARPRTLVLQRGFAGRIVYDLLTAPEPQTSDLDVAPPASVSDRLDQLVAELSAGIGGDEVDSLATHGIEFVIVADATARNDPLVATLDGQRGLRHLSSRGGGAVWQITTASGRSQLIDPPQAAAAGTVVVRSARSVALTSPDPRTPAAVDSVVAAGSAGRRLVLSETVDSRWGWTANGAPVTPEPAQVPGVGADQSLQQVGLDASAVPVTIAFDGSSRAAWLWVELVVLLVVALLALPSRRAEADDDEGDEPAQVDAAALDADPDDAGASVGPDERVGAAVGAAPSSVGAGAASAGNAPSGTASPGASVTADGEDA